MSTAKRILQNISTIWLPSNEQGQYLMPAQKRLTLLSDTVAQKYVAKGYFRWYGPVVDPDPEPEPEPTPEPEPEPQPEPTPDPEPAPAEDPTE